MAQWVACDRQAATALGGRCRNQAATNRQCISVASHKDGTAPRADAPDVVLVKFKLFGGALNTALNLFREVERNEELVSEAHELVATMTGRKFQGVRATGDRGDSGTPVFGKHGFQNPYVMGLNNELGANGFVLSDVHCWERRGTNEGFLVLGYRRGGKPILLNGPQREFLVRSYRTAWGVAHVWANIPEYVWNVDGKSFRLLLLGEEKGNLRLIATRPKIDEVWTVPKSEISLRREIIHTVNISGRTKEGEEAESELIYNDGLWGVR